MAHIGKTWASIVAVVIGTVGVVVTPAQAASDSRVRFVAPANHSQLSASGQVTVTIEVTGRLDPATLRLKVNPDGSPPAVDLTDRLTIDGDTATAELGPADLTPGILRFSADARRRSGHGDRKQAQATVSWEPQIDASTAGRCELLGQNRCLLPFPNDFFTVPDASTDTGRRVNFDLESMPANVNGVHIDPTDWNRNDGFSPGALILALRARHRPRHDRRGADHRHRPVARQATRRSCSSTRTTGERHPFFAELDSRPRATTTALLIIRPARNLPRATATSSRCAA